MSKYCSFLYIFRSLNQNKVVQRKRITPALNKRHNSVPLHMQLFRTVNCTGLWLQRPTWKYTGQNIKSKIKLIYLKNKVIIHYDPTDESKGVFIWKDPVLLLCSWLFLN